MSRHVSWFWHPMQDMQPIEKGQEVLWANHAETSTKRKERSVMSALSRCFQTISFHQTTPWSENNSIKPNKLRSLRPKFRLIGDAFLLALQEVIHLGLPQIKANLLGRRQHALHSSQLTEADSLDHTLACQTLDILWLCPKLGYTGIPPKLQFNGARHNQH